MPRSSSSFSWHRPSGSAWPAKANNSLNSADALYAQCRNYGYNIHEMSQAEDFVVVEDMSSQPRVLPDGKVIEYGSTYRQLHALSHATLVVIEK